MKSLVQIAFVALLLFSVSAALSLWLNQSKQAAADPASEKTEKKNREGEKKNDKEPGESKSTPKSEGVPASPVDMAAAAALRENESRLRRRAEQMEVVLRDLQSERERVESLLKQVNTELKLSTARNSEVESKSADLEKKKVELDAAEKKNIERIAGMYDAMAPESAAPILRQMADNGRLDTAVKVLYQMKERQAARVLAELGDPALAAQLIERLRALKSQVVPAAGKTGPS